MSLSKPSTRWIIFLSLIGGATGVAWLIQKRRKLSQENDRKIKLRQKIDRQLCYGRPETTTVVVSSIAEWKLIENRFLDGIDSTRIMGLDCEWLSDGKVNRKVIRVYESRLGLR